ncbi:hypothetical protein O181_034799 [Austropuccinia psidii MF-1]|uniref:Uncharacterized protein n=1 Tax=Austropuccinia psidii MF-1 TaxID=1389203 RepID=A0A9Q3H9X3_9BASI|nr:hypothetical protein [Austropuccinia psidii MF-1]
MSSKLTELTESSPSALSPSVLCGSGILSQLASPWSMDSSGHFDSAQAYDGYKAPSPHTGLPASNIRKYLWSKKDGPFGKYFPVSEAPTLDGTSGCSNMTGSRQINVGGLIVVGDRPIYSSSEFPISRINTKGVVKQIRQIANSPPYPDAEDSDELDSEEVEVVHNSAGKQSSTSPSHLPAKRFQSQIVPSTPRTFQPILSTIKATFPPASQICPQLGLPWFQK